MQGPTFLQYSCFTRTARDGDLGRINRRFFPTARDLLNYLTIIESLDPGNPIMVTMARREVGAFQRLRRVEIEAIAAEEGSE